MAALASVLLLSVLFQYLYAVARRQLSAFLAPLFSSLPHSEGHISPEAWLSSPLLLLSDRLLYAALFPALAWLFCYHILPQPCKRWPLGSIGSRGHLGRALFFGLLGGASACLAVLFVTNTFPQRLFPSHSVPSLLVAHLTSDRSLFLWHLLFTALLTAFLEEGAYRGCFQYYLEMQTESRFWPIIFSTLLFALGHGQVFFVMLLPSLLFSVLFWRWRLLSSILAHAAYNGLILTIAVWGCR